ncbi:GntR family transcriptional regulator [Kordia sp. YSTF-M3]|uniref:GntR family transcriptional regulator n=1 Tax=Kordia aestuariivivens TaxID=2759037 RepID=A0ABR7Q7M0_9FLAO|nr:S1-like domain-containing RNA-binding protein [Kordia aestuariivivens]MBC8754572.1 GntR family transcriptional regulator [Kordia aestuariivivens]
MIHLGQLNTLEILRETPPGLFLGDEEGNDILLPNKYVPTSFEIGDKLTVFAYLDSHERPVTTTLKPYMKVNEFGLLRVTALSDYGAFLDWGLEKDLFVPFKEQARDMEEGKWYVVYCYLDEETNRLVGSSKTNKYISNEELTVERFDEVDLMVSRFTDLGVEMIINQKHKGLVYKDEIFRDLKLGEKLKGVISKIRDDNKIDLSLQHIGYKNIEPSAQVILDALERNGGSLSLHDKSDPEEIKKRLNMSKKSFKKAIGSLYKQELITLNSDSIELK